MKGRFVWGTLGLVLTALSLAMLYVFPENPIVMNLLALPRVLSVTYGFFHAGVTMLSVSGVSVIVDRL